MLVLRDPAQTSSIPDLEIRALVEERFAMVSENEAYDPDLYGYFIVMQAGDTLAALDEQLGFSVLANSRAYGLLDAKPFIEAVNALMNESDEPADKKPQSLHWPVSLALNDLPCPPLGADRR